MEQSDELRREIVALRDRLSRLSEASLRINESLDLETVLQGVLDSARSLTGARYGVLHLVDQSGRLEHYLFSGLTLEQTRMPDGMTFFEHLISIEEPLRVRDFHSYLEAQGLPDFRPPFPVSSTLPFLVAPIRHWGERVGSIQVGETESGSEFTSEDEETLVMFASQAAQVIANARRHRDELRARADLEALVNTAPVGVLVLDARTGGVKSVNREAMRIASDLYDPAGNPEDLLSMLSYRRADGRKIAPTKIIEELIAGDTVRAEEIVIEVPDGRSVTTLVNGTPIRMEDG